MLGNSNLIIVMQQFTVPQFIDVEDKILGPVTIRQLLFTSSCSIFDFYCGRCQWVSSGPMVVAESVCGKSLGEETIILF